MPGSRPGSRYGGGGGGRGVTTVPPFVTFFGTALGAPDGAAEALGTVLGAGAALGWVGGSEMLNADDGGGGGCAVTGVSSLFALRAARRELMPRPSPTIASTTRTGAAYTTGERPAGRVASTAMASREAPRSVEAPV